MILLVVDAFVALLCAYGAYRDPSPWWLLAVTFLAAETLDDFAEYRRTRRR